MAEPSNILNPKLESKNMDYIYKVIDTRTGSTRFSSTSYLSAIRRASALNDGGIRFIVKPILIKS